MDHDLQDLYGRASEWALTRVQGASTELDAVTLCDGWDVRTLMNHMLETQRYFVGVARGEDVTPPSSTPPELLSGDPVADFSRGRDEIISAFAQPGVVEKTGPSLGVAFSDQLLHGWDVAMATGQDPAMPEGLPATAYELIHGLFTEEQRKGVFKPEVVVPENASAQDRLLAYTGRDPAGSGSHSSV
jgi:uncharacterized protein (TIGR03086 family)